MTALRTNPGRSRAGRRIGLVLLLASWLSACPKNGPEAVDALGPLLAAADRAWEQRDRNGLDPVEDALQRAYATVPSSPEVAWRMARLKVARGLVFDDEDKRVEAFGQAREIAWTCMFDDPSVRALQIEVGLKNALRALPPERQRCALWATHAWTRWMADFGADAASLDLDRLDSLTRYLERRKSGGDPASTRGPTSRTDEKTRKKKQKKGQGSRGRRFARTERAQTTEWSDEERARITWTAGLLLAIRPDWAGRDAAQGASLLAEVVQSDPRNLLPMADLVRFGPESSREEWQIRLRGQRPSTPESRAYVARVLASAAPVSSVPDESEPRGEP